MTPKQFRKFLDRDGACPHCGDVETAVPNHRINRGMGGSKVLDRPSNIVVICSLLNGLIESDDRWFWLAKEYGWKLSSWQVPEETPVYWNGVWYLLDNDFGRREVTVSQTTP